MKKKRNIKKFNELFEASVGEDGLKNFKFGEKNSLDTFMEDNEKFFYSNNLTVSENDGIYVITNENDDLYTISKEDEGYLVSYSLENGQVGEYFMPLYDIINDIPTKLIRSNKAIAPIDLVEYGIDKKYIASENEEEIIEKKNTSENGKITMTTPEASISNNKDYNFDPTPGHKDTNPYYNNVNSKRIEIGDPDPIKSFKEWSGKFWRKSGDQYKKYEPNSGVSEEEETVGLEYSNNSNAFVDIANTEIKYKTWNKKYENNKNIKKED